MNLSTLKSSVAGREWPVVLAFILPAVFVLVFLRLVPGIQGLIHSFQVKGSFVGFSNYRYLFTHENALNSIQVTLWFNLVINPFQILVAFMIALLLEQKLPGTDIFRIIIFVPIAVPLAVSSIIWGVAFRPDDGLINALLQLMRIPPQQWLTSTKQALYSIMILASWVGVGYWMIFLVAGLKNIPESYYESAAIDGANYLQALFQITVPLMKRPLAFVLVADTVSNFLLFPPIQILTQGGPENSTNLFMNEIYTNAFKYGDYGLAYAETIVLIGLMLVIVSIQFHLLKSEEDKA